MERTAVERTIDDWLTHADLAPSAEERARCLDAAAAQAVEIWEWRALLAGVAALEPLDRERLGAVAARTLEAAAAARDLWGFRDVAALRARLGDRDGARLALAEGARALRAPSSPRVALRGPARGYEWALLGQGFAETLGDDDGLRRCLEEGAAAARAAGDASDLSTIAVAWAKALDREAGVALLREAEALAGGRAARAAWTLANAWRELGEPAEAARVLVLTLATAASVEDALTVVRAWASHGELPPARAALARAEALAGDDLGGWLAIAETAHETRVGEAAVRGALGRAEALAGDGEARAAVSRGYRLWLRDEAAADRLGPRGLPPAELRRRVRELPGWTASAAALLDWLRARVPAETLRRIAEADYGHGADVHLAALQDLCETGLVPRHLPWEPHEVVALCRWQEGERVDHLERALCAALLVLAPAGDDELVTNGPILVESCLALGPEVIERCEELLAWRWEGDDPDVDWGDELDPERPVALLLLLVLGAARAPDDPRLEALARAIGEEAGGDLPALAAGLAGGMRAALWDELLARALAPLRASRPAVAALLAGLGR